MPTGPDMAFIARPIAFTNNTGNSSPRLEASFSHHSSPGELSGHTLFSQFDADHLETVRQAQDSPSPRTSWPLTRRGAKLSPQRPRHLESHFSLPTTLAPESEATEDIPRDVPAAAPSTDGRPSIELDTTSTFHTPKQASACDVRVVQSLIESLKIDPMAVAAAAVDLHNYRLHATLSTPSRRISDAGSYTSNVNQEYILGLENPPKMEDDADQIGACALDHKATVKTFNSNGFLSPPPSPRKKRAPFGSPGDYVDEVQEVTVQDVTAALKAGFVPQGTASMVFSERLPKLPLLEEMVVLPTGQGNNMSESDSGCAQSSTATAVGCATWV